MAPPNVTMENATIENYIYLIVIKLAVLIILKCLKVVYKIHASYKKSVKRKYAARDIEAARPNPSPRST